MRIALIDLVSNPERDFKLYPIDKAQVATLKSSISELGFWGGVTCRPNPNEDGTYQIAAGHHRIQAALEAGVTHAEFDVKDYSDNQMSRIMISENMTQRGYNAAAIMDSVASAVRRVSTMVLEVNSLCEISQSGLIETQNAFNAAKGSMLKGGIGRDVLMRFMRDKGPTVDEVKAALAMLKSSGTMARIMDEVVKAVEAKKRAEAKTAVDDAKKSGDADAVTEAKAKVENVEKEADKMEAAVDAMEKKPVTYDERVPSVFKTSSHEKAFRDIVTGENGQRFIPIKQQYGLAVAVQEHLDNVPKGRLSGAAELKRYIQTEVIDKALGIHKQNDADEAKRLLGDSMQKKVEAQWKTVSRGVNMSLGALSTLRGLYEKWDEDFPAPLDEAAKAEAKDTCERLLKLLKTENI